MKNTRFGSLSGSESFDRVFKEGVRVRTRFGTVRVRAYAGNEAPETTRSVLPASGLSAHKRALHPASLIRIGFVVRKALGTAVERNRARRVARAAVREAWERFQSRQPRGASRAHRCQSFDVVIQLTSIDVDRDELVDSVKEALERSVSRAQGRTPDMLS